MGDTLDTVLALNILADIYFKFVQAGAEITPDNLKEHLESLKAKADANDEIIGVDVNQ